MEQGHARQMNQGANVKKKKSGGDDPPSSNITTTIAKVDYMEEESGSRNLNTSSAPGQTQELKKKLRKKRRNRRLSQIEREFRKELEEFNITHLNCSFKPEQQRSASDWVENG